MSERGNAWIVLILALAVLYILSPVDVHGRKAIVKVEIYKKLKRFGHGSHL